LYAESLEKTVRDVVEPLISGLGYSLVDLTIGRLSGSTRVNVVIYRKEGVGVDECAEVSSMLFPRLETIEDLADPSLEVSSPGIDRAMKGPSEYAIFRGRGVRILAGEATEWESGIIDRVEEGTLWLRRGKEKRGFAISEIRKARLDHSVEVEETKNAV
jgi:ribosome maturation factor RimP